VVRGERSDPQALATAAAFAQRLGKVPVIVADAPGFFVNRVLTPYLNEALLLLEAGAGIARIDAALRGFGMPMGPLRLLDEIGLDISDHVATAIAPLFGDRLPAAGATKRLRESGRLGRKNGRGFYRHGSGKPEPDPEVEAMFRAGGAPPAGDEIVDRCVLLMLNETCRALAEEIVASPRLADLALVMGTGFAPFRGGILRFADESGLAALTERMRALAERLGPRFTPSERLAETADGGSFYGADWPAP
jgi:3-hydroxyacyl-CoA dehydrogenase